MISGAFEGLGQTLRKIAYSNALYQISLRGDIPDQLDAIPRDPWPGEVDRGRLMIDGEMTYAGLPQSDDPRQWSSEALNNEPWVFWAHGFAWLRDLRSLGGNRARRKARDLTALWRMHFDRWHPMIWRPDIVGKRIASILGMHDFFLASADDGFRYETFAMIRRQAGHLIRTYDRACPPGTARLVALRGMIYATLSFKDLRDHLPSALDHLKQELKQQILADGSHISRCPSAHVRALRCVIDIRHALSTAGQTAPDHLSQVIRAMMPVMGFYRHGDGHLALFNGSDYGSSTMMDLMRNHARSGLNTLIRLPHGGFERITSGSSLLLFDSGSQPPAPYNVRTHRGPLAFEFSHRKERLIVNCGYLCAGPHASVLQPLLCQTAAHSTATIDHCCPAAPPRSKIERFGTAHEPMVRGRHKGYGEQFGLIHKRQLALIDQGLTLDGRDTFEGEIGHTITLRFHLHPDCQALITGQGASVLIKTKNGDGWRFRAEGYTLRLEESIYAPAPDRGPAKCEQIVIETAHEKECTKINWRFSREQKD